MPYDVSGTWTNMPTWFKIVGVNDPTQKPRFSNLKLVGYRSIDPNSTTIHRGISVEDAIDFRIDHICLEHACGGGISISGMETRGVIDHNRLENFYGFDDLANYVNGNIGYGVEIHRALAPLTYEPLMSVLGQYKAGSVYLEDNYFSKWRHCVASAHGAHYVFRHNIVDLDFGHFSLDAHGLRDSQLGYAGARCTEIYENTFINADLTSNRCIFQCGGGSGVFFNNYVDESYIYMSFYSEDVISSTVWHVRDFYMWSAKGTTPTVTFPIAAIDPSRNVLQDWSRNAGLETESAYPNVDSLWSIAGYKPFTYPHPLIGGEIVSETMTPMTVDLDEGNYRISMPSTFIDQPSGKTYNFEKWEDESTSPVRTISLTMDMTMTANYVEETIIPPPTSDAGGLGIIIILASVIILGIAAFSMKGGD